MHLRRTMYLLRISLFLSTVPVFLIAQNDTHGIDPKNIDTTVKPCDNFYQYANGNWLKHHPIPPAFSSWGSFVELGERNNDALHEILEAAAKDANAPEGSNRKKIGDFFTAGMDSARIEHLGWRPIANELEQIKSLTGIEDVPQQLARLHHNGVGGLFGFGSGQDLKNSSDVIGQLDQGGLGLPDRDYYVAEDERSRSIREEYVKHIAAIFKLIGDDDTTAVRNANAVMAFETRLAKASRTRVERRDPDKNYNKMTQAELAALTPDFAWTRFFEGVGWQNPGVVNVGQPEFFNEVNAMMKNVSLDDWKVYLRWRVVNNAAPSLSSPFVEENFRFYGSVLTGAKEMQPRWKRIMRVIDGLMGEALGELYVEKTFPPKAKQRAKEMVNNLIQAFREHIQQYQWMDDTTRAAALKKLAAVTVKIGYPDKWRDYSSLTITRDSYYNDIRNSDEFAVRRTIAKIGKPVDRTEWGMTPPTVNAYYSSSRNEIVFPAGILQPPFFDFEADDAVNYGGMGAVIGHELSHGFDDQGSKFDAEGNLKMWWTPETRKKFEERTALIVKQFDGYIPIDTLHVNGKLTLGENIGDLGGLSIAYTALQNALKDKPRPVIDGFTPEQRFFLSWAQIWRRNIRPERLRLQVKTDPHSPAEFRTNGPLSNMKEFLRAFGCGDASAMARPNDLRATIW